MSDTPGSEVTEDEGKPRFDAGEQHSVETRARRVKRLARERDATLAGILDVLAGRRLVWWLLEQCHVFQVSMVPGGTPEQTAFREGERNIGLLLLSRVMAVSPDAFARMQADKHDDPNA